MNIRNASGNTLMSTLATLAFVSGIVMATIPIIVSTQKKSEDSSASLDTNDLLERALTDTKRVLIQIDNGSKGLCRLVSTNVTTGGIGNIDLNVFPKNTSSDPLKDDWTSAFSSGFWVKDETCNLKNGYEKCFVMGPDALKFYPAFLNRQVKMTSAFYPIKLQTAIGKPLNMIPLDPQNPTSSPAKDTGFLIAASISYLDSDHKKTKTVVGHSMIWVGEFTCQRGGLFLNASGIGSVYDPKIVFENAIPLGNDLVEVAFDPVTITEAKIVTINNQLRAQTSFELTDNSPAACTQKRFQCRSEAPEWLDVINLAGRIEYHRQNRELNDNSITITPQVFFATQGDVSDREFRSKVTMNSDLSFTEYVSGNKISVLTGGASSPFKLNVNKANDPQNCPSLCNAQNNFNYNPNPRAGGAPAKEAKYLFLDLPLTGVAPEKTNIITPMAPYRPLDCVCCQVKQCDGISAKNSDYCSLKSIEALDARIPECQGKETQYTQEMEPFSSVTKAPGACLVGTLNNGQLNFTFEDCSQNLSSLCFAQGNFIPTPDKGNFDSSSQRCYNLGHETISKADLDDLLSAQGTTPGFSIPLASDGKNYSFINAGLAGIFLAPQTPEEKALAVLGIQGKSVKGVSKNPDRKTEKFWISMRGDSMGEVFAEPPWIPAQTSDLVSYYDLRLKFEKDNAHPFTIGSNDAVLLLHSRRYFGALKVISTQSLDLPVFCYDTTKKDFTLSSLKTKTALGAKSICESAGLLFIPPRTSLQWIKALMDLNPIDKMFPWPSGTDIKAAWIGLTWKNSQWDLFYDFNPTTSLIDKYFTSLADPHSQGADVSLCKNSTSITVEEGDESCTHFVDLSLKDSIVGKYKSLIAMDQKLKEKGKSNLKVRVSAKPQPPPPPTPEPSSSPSP